MPTRIPFSNNRRTEHEHGLDDRYVYQLVPQTPPLDEYELDSSDSALEIVILWGGMSVLHVAHLAPPRDFYLGDDPQRDDFVVGADTLGSERLPIVLESNGELSLVLARGSSGEIERDGERIALDPDTRQYPLRRGDCARVRHGDFTFIVRSVAAARRGVAAMRPAPDVRNSRWTMASAALHALLLFGFYFLPPKSAALSLDLVNTDERLVRYTIEARENRIEEEPKWLDNKSGAAAGGGEPAAGPRGAAGKPDSRQRDRRMAIKGNDQEERVSREQQQELVDKSDLLALLRVSAGTLAPSSPYSRSAAQGYDAENALGNLLGAQIGESFGWSGLGPSGTGRGGGGNADGTIAVGPSNTRGRGWDGYQAVGGSFRDRTARVPHIRVQQVDIHGSLSKEAIRRVINRHNNEIKFCYEQQLIAHPDLQGRVSTKFIIAPTGAVQTAVVTESQLGNAAAEQCIAQAVRRWIFPTPEGGGLVVVTYPFLLSQTGE